MSSKLQMQYRVVNRCRAYIAQAPDITPYISGLSTYSSVATSYTIVYVTGNNFSLQGSTGVSTITFGNIKNIPVTYLSPNNIAFVVPNNLGVGTYAVKVANNNYPTSLYSNLVYYTLT